MKSNFAFLKEYWPDMAQIGETAEEYLYSDPNACIYKLGMLAERITSEMFSIEKIVMPEEDTQVNKLKVLKREGLLPQNIDNILYALRKARNEAVHAGTGDTTKAETLLKMTYSLCCWFMEVYGDWNYKNEPFTMPADKSHQPDYAEILKSHEEKIEELMAQVEEIITLAAAKSKEDRAKHAETVSEQIELSGPEEDYLVAEQVRIEVDALPIVNYALQQNGIPVIKGITIVNQSDQSLNDLELYISSQPEMCLEVNKHIECVPMKSTFSVRDIKIDLNGEFLAQLTERISGFFKVSLVSDGNLLSSETVPINVLAYDEWHGSVIYPEIISAFVTPNHPEITKIVARASALLGQWTGDPSLDAYQSKDVNRVLKQAAAVYSALHEERIVYAVPPASFERIGQRVRMCDAIMQQKMGTCLDLSLLYASCLEAIGLNPLLILQKGHMFAGLWLEETSFSEPIQDDASLVTKRLAEGINEIAVVECTAFVDGRDVTFDNARKSAEEKMNNFEALEYIIDVKRSRLSGVRPVPMRVMTPDGWRVVKEHKDDSDEKNVPKNVLGAINTDDVAQTPATRKLRWERKLLDVGLRNALINLRLTKSVIPILASSLDELEDALSDGSDFSVLAKPIDWQFSNAISFDNIHELGPYEQLISSEFHNKRLRAIYTESELEDAIKNVYRSAKTSLEENGANTLYLALGLLKWYENPKSTKPRYAPLVLIPVEMVRKSVAQGYIIRIRDDEPQMNITMLEKIKQDFGIEVDGVDPLPLDEHGVDVRRVFTILRKAIMEQKNWDILESACLGIFSFSQFVMWNDLRNRSAELEKNKIVKSLMEGRLCWDAEPMEIGDSVSEDDVFLPLSADASQLFAIKEAGKGQTFVLHGPPGTGKSQTITAMIANAMAQGETVLFVAEKMAALEVVQKRLENIGIGPFCLELHSNKSKKKDVLDQLQQAADVVKKQPQEKFQQKVEQIQKLRKDLDCYAVAIHQKRSCGMSLYELINEYEANKISREITQFDRDFIKTMDSKTFEDQTILVERLVAAARAVGHPYNHPLSPIRCKEYSQQFRILIPQTTEKYRDKLLDLKTKADAFCEAVPLSCSTKSDLERSAEVAKRMLIWYDVPQSWAKVPGFETFADNVKALAEQGLLAKKYKTELQQNWRDEFFDLDGQALMNEYQTAASKWVLSKALGISALAKKMALYSKNGGKVSKSDLPNQLFSLINYQKAKAAMKDSVEPVRSQLEGYYKGEETDWQSLESMIENASKSQNVMKTLTGTDDIRKTLCGEARLKDTIKNFFDAVVAIDEPQKAFDSLLDISQEDRDEWIGSQLVLLKSINEHYDDIREWITWKGIEAEALKIGLKPVIEAYETGMPHEEIVKAYRREITKELAMDVIDNDALLSSFAGTVFNEKVEQFRKMDAELTDLTRKEIFSRLAANVPNFSRETAQSSELNILLRAIKNGGRGLSIRKLFEQIPNILPRLCPCMLMSPISAAQYLDPKREPFDLVIFDEASQIPTCKAVGALARGKNAVVVGDPKQMPPTSFFETNTVDEEHIETEDLESILDDCLALNMPQTHLLWHYRSRHESLIAFSNHQFYDNRLYTFPSVNDRENKVSIVYLDGTFERGKSRTNREEAKAVVAELVKRCHDEQLSSQSIGVVTFNVSQQNLIDDLLTEACRKDSKLEEWAYNAAEPLFIKNLENVQGDERDVILFSVGYGPDQSGKVSMNFGPLNREGGWRRLNVAVSRARCEMKVFSSLRPEQINLSRTSSEGVAALKAFLEYAAGQPLTEDENTVKDYKEDCTGIIDSICNTLKQHGYDTDRMVGHSEYKIDIGIVDPENKEQYLCGILLDGNTYGTAKSTRDREIAQKSVLKGLGWTVLRVWVMDWWDNPTKEMNRILSFLRDGEDPNDTTSNTEPEVIEEESENEETTSEGFIRIGALDLGAGLNTRTVARAKVYEAVELPQTDLFEQSDFYATHYYDKRICDNIQILIDKEAPLSYNLLIKRISQSFGFARSGARIQKKIDDMLQKMNLKTCVWKEQTYYWRTDQTPDEYTGMRYNGEGLAYRDIREVPIQEITNAICYVLFDQISLSEEDLAREAAKLLGYTRMGSNVIPAVESAIKYAKFLYLIEQDNKGSFILTAEGKERAQAVTKCVQFDAVSLDGKRASGAGAKRGLTWDAFYEKYDEWQPSTLKTKISQLVDIGSPDDVITVCSSLWEPEVGDKLIAKAISLGCKFAVKQLLDVVGVSGNGVASICRSINTEELKQSSTISHIITAFDDYELGDSVARVAIENGAKMKLNDIKDIAPCVSEEMLTKLIDTVAPEDYNSNDVVDCIEVIDLDEISEKLIKKAVKYGCRFTEEQKETLATYVDISIIR